MCFSFISTYLTSSSQPYAPIKKNDDFPSTEVQDWIEFHPIDKQMSRWDTQRIQDFVRDTIKTLPIQYITLTNLQSVKKHLYELANTSGRSRAFLLEKIRKINNIDVNLRSELLTRVIDSYSSSI